MSHVFLSVQDEQQIVDAIKQAEDLTSGEIRVHIEPGVKAIEVLQRAKEVFNKLEMYNTQAKNGVLFYVGYNTKSFAIIGDQAIDAVVAPDFWDATKDIVLNYFSKGEFKQGLIQGILNAGEQLKKYFPYQSDDINELSDEISRGE